MFPCFCCERINKQFVQMWFIETSMLWGDFLLQFAVNHRLEVTCDYGFFVLYMAQGTGFKPASIIMFLTNFERHLSFWLMPLCVCQKRVVDTQFRHGCNEVGVFNGLNWA